MPTVHPLVALAILALAACGSSTTGTPSGTSPDGGGTTTSTGTSTAGAKLIINELQPANKDTITDENGDADDWIEIYNPGTSAVDLKGYTFSDSANKQAISASLPVPAGGYALIWADDSPAQGSGHLGFKLSAKSGDTITLSDPSGKTVDTVTFGPATDQNAYARFPNGSGDFAWCGTPSPGATNGSACGTP